VARMTTEEHLRSLNHQLMLCLTILVSRCDGRRVNITSQELAKTSLADVLTIEQGINIDGVNLFVKPGNPPTIRGEVTREEAQPPAGGERARPLPASGDVGRGVILGLRDPGTRD
jgi:hypothetical protein